LRDRPYRCRREYTAGVLRNDRRVVARSWHAIAEKYPSA
jgi:hypothetical protein